VIDVLGVLLFTKRNRQVKLKEQLREKEKEEKISILQ
jgi:hypothetical protein